METFYINSSPTHEKPTSSYLKHLNDLNDLLDKVNILVGSNVCILRSGVSYGCT